MQSRIMVTETVQDAPGASGATIPSEALNQGQQRYSPTTTVPVSRYSAGLYTLSGSGSGEETVDLTDLAGTQANVDGTGLKINGMRLRTSGDNTAAVTVGPAAVDGYEPFGAGVSIDVPPGAEFTFRFEDQLDDISDTSGSSAKNLLLSGNADDTIYIELLLG